MHIDGNPLSEEFTFEVPIHGTDVSADVGHDFIQTLDVNQNIEIS